MNTQIPILDTEVLERMRVDYGEKILSELIEDFKRIGKDSIEGFNKAADANDQKLMIRYAHDLKSSAAALGLKRLSKVSKEIEIASNDGRLDDACALGSDMELTLTEAVRSLVTNSSKL